MPLDENQLIARKILAHDNAVFPPDLRSRAFEAVNGMLAWRLDDTEAAIRSLETAGAAIAAGNLWADDGKGKGVQVTPVIHGKVRSHAWECRREDGEGWAPFTRRAAAAARANVPLAARVATEFSPDLASYVRFHWITEGQAALFDLPPAVRSCTDEAAQEGDAPWAYTGYAGFNLGIRLRKTDRVRPGSFYSVRAVESLAEIPTDARFLRLTGKAAQIERLREFLRLETLQIGPVGERELSLIAQLPALRMLILTHVTTTSLDPLAHLSRLEHLGCGDSSSLTSLAALAALPRLRTLTLSGLGKLDYVTEVARLRQLWGLDFGGSQWKDVRVASLQPLTALTNLRSLRFTRVRVADGSLRPLTALWNLRTLDLSNWFAMDQFAEIAAACPNLRPATFNSMWWVPPEPCDGNEILACKRCHAFRLGMTMGKPKKQLCPRCDQEKIAKHSARWEALVAAARERLAHSSAGRGSS